MPRSNILILLEAVVLELYHFYIISAYDNFFPLQHQTTFLQVVAQVFSKSRSTSCTFLLGLKFSQLQAIGSLYSTL